MAVVDNRYAMCGDHALDLSLQGIVIGTVIRVETRRDVGAVGSLAKTPDGLPSKFVVGTSSVVF